MKELKKKDIKREIFYENGVEKTLVIETYTLKNDKKIIKKFVTEKYIS